MNEKEFTAELVGRLRPLLKGYKVETEKSLLISSLCNPNKLRESMA